MKSNEELLITIQRYLLKERDIINLETDEADVRTNWGFVEGKGAIVFPLLEIIKEAKL